MAPPPRIAAFLLPFLAACSSTASRVPQIDDDWPRDDDAPPLGILVTGMFGLTEIELQDLELDSSFGEAGETEESTLPIIGAVVQKPFAGERVRVGLEGGGTLSWEGELETVIVGSGGALLTADNDFFHTDLFAGPFADLLVGEKLRFYAAAGPLMQFASIDAEWTDPVFGDVEVDEDGFGAGYYARTGFEIEFGSLSLGFGIRFVDSSVDMNGEIDEVDIEELQYLVTATRPM
jgi:hypothetical protein